MIFGSFLAAYFIHAEAHICEVGREKDETNTWKWVLPYPDSCLCTEVIMGGINTRTPIRPFKPTYAFSPLLSDDIGKIREHYNLTCEEEGREIGIGPILKKFHEIFICIQK